jgi:hypothetical protein
VAKVPFLVTALAPHASKAVSYYSQQWHERYRADLITFLEQLTVVFLAPLDVVAEAVPLCSIVRERHLTQPTVVDYSKLVSNPSEKKREKKEQQTNSPKAPPSSQRKKSLGMLP